jgi:hypothetical protein
VKPQSLLEITKSHSHSNEEDSCSSFSTKSMGGSSNQMLSSSSPLKRQDSLHPSTSECRATKSLNISTSSDISSIGCDSNTKEDRDKFTIGQPQSMLCGAASASVKENTSSNCSIDDSGNFSTTDNEIRSYFNDRINNVMDKVNNYYLQLNEKNLSASNSFSIVEDNGSNEHVCANLCALIKMQLVKAMLEVRVLIQFEIYSINDSCLF